MSSKDGIALTLAAAAIQRPNFELTAENAALLVDFYDVMLAVVNKKYTNEHYQGTMRSGIKA